MKAENNKRVRITSLTDDNGAKKHFALKGITESLAEMKFDIDYTMSSPLLLENLVKSVRKFVKKQLSIRETVEEKLNYIHSLDIDPIVTLQVKEVTASSHGNKELAHLQKLLHSCMSKANRVKTETEDLQVAEVIISNEHFERVGYAAFDGTIENKRDGHEIYFVVDPSGKRRLYNLDRIMADVIVIQALRKYEVEQPGMLKEYMVEHFINSDNQLMGLPKSGDLKKEFLAVAQGMKADTTDVSEFENLEEVCYAFFNRKRLVKESEEMSTMQRYTLQTSVRHAKRMIDFDSWENFRKVFEGDMSSFTETNYLRYRNNPYFLTLVRGFIQDATIASFNYEQEREYNKTCARAFENKKHNKKTHKERAANTVFLNFYSKVELDDDTRLPLMDAAEADLMELNTVIPVPVRKDYEFKVKRLGKHRALGLFYPGLKMTLIDVKSPSSYIHELGHQIDHILAGASGLSFYSETSAFRPIRNLYTSLMDKKVKGLDEDHPFRKTWEGKTKYSKLYYLTPTEIFARSFEVYMLKFDLKLNSLLKTKEEIEKSDVHLLDEQYVALVTEFFDGIMEQLKEINGNTTQTVEATKETKKENTEKVVAENKKISRRRTSVLDLTDVITGSEQLTLF